MKYLKKFEELSPLHDYDTLSGLSIIDNKFFK